MAPEGQVPGSVLMSDTLLLKTLDCCINAENHCGGKITSVNNGENDKWSSSKSLDEELKQIYAGVIF